ncbi:salicylate hydroxylase [Astrocystis sublimbata]|nr:salicylate hydroxylase [Astrocystis sublimbata]
MASNRFRVAIVGGGLAGATLANALLQLSQIEVHVFESAPEFSERGAAVGLAINAQMALNEILSGPAAVALLDKAGGVATNTSRILLGSGPEAGSLIFDLAEGDPGRTLHRASLLRELLAPLPKDSLHAKKQLLAINAKDESIELSFQDASVYLFDAVNGADGIFSFVRDHVLGDQAATCAASPAGFWNCRNLVPFEKAKAALGEEYFEVDRQWDWVGEGAFLMHDPLENRAVVQCVVSAIEEDPGTNPKDRKRPLSRELLEKSLHSWLDGPIAKGIIDLALDQEDPSSYSQWEHKHTPTYAKKRVCVMGDAAHATTPWQGAGVGLAIEDAMVLGALLAKVSSKNDFEHAFQAYDAVRRPRCQQIIDSSRETGHILCGQSGLRAEELRGLLAPQWNFLFGLDMSGHKQEALDKMREIQQKA